MPAEILTALIAAYLAVHLPWASVATVLQASQLVLVAVAALVVAGGAWRRTLWAPKAIVTLAALGGATNLTTLSGVFVLREKTFGPAVVLSYALVAVLSICQFFALFVGLRHLAARDPSAVR